MFLQLKSKRESKGQIQSCIPIKLHIPSSMKTERPYLDKLSTQEKADETIALRSQVVHSRSISVSVAKSVADAYIPCSLLPLAKECTWLKSTMTKVKSI